MQAGRIQSAWYRPPYGCGFGSNNKFKAWLYNEFAGDKDFTCIARHTSAASKKAKVTYSPILRGYPTVGENYYCLKNAMWLQ